MGRLTGGALGLLVSLTLLPGTLLAQEDPVPPVLPGAPSAEGQAQTRTCRQVLPSDFRRIVNSRSQEIVYFRDPVRFLCTGGVRLEADSAVVNRAASSVELIGRVVYVDSIRALDADWANYLGRMDQLLARGAVVLRDLEGGAVIEGNNLNYLRETDIRPETRMIVTGGRPYAVIPPRQGDDPAPDTAPAARDTVPAAPDTAAAPTEIWADRMEFLGEDVFEAQGDVDLRRGDMVGAGRSAVFDQREGRMTLVEDAFVESEAYRLQGDRIEAFLEGEALREVQSVGAARLTSAELVVRAERVRIGFQAGALERLEAWNPDPPAATRRARADAEGFRLRADSIDARADSIGLREIRAVGRAYGERDTPAEQAAAAPVAERAVANPTTGAAAITRDWIQGDTIHGYFQHVAVAREPGTEADIVADRDPDLDAGGESGQDPGQAGAETEVVLERVVVIGGSAPALSLYRMAGETAADRPSINFMKANRIILFMAQGELDRVEAEGPIEGVFLEPSGQGQGQDQGQSQGQEQGQGAGGEGGAS